MMRADLLAGRTRYQVNHVVNPRYVAFSRKLSSRNKNFMARFDKLWEVDRISNSIRKNRILELLTDIWLLIADFKSAAELETIGFSRMESRFSPKIRHVPRSLSSEANAHAATWASRTTGLTTCCRRASSTHSSCPWFRYSSSLDRYLSWRMPRGFSSNW